MKKSNYFSERLERLLRSDIRRSKITQIRIKRGYKRAFQLIEDDIAKYVTRISDDLKLDAKALKRKIPKEELLSRAKELQLEEETMANYENLSYAEAIRREMVKNVESMAKENESLIFENLFKTYEHNFYSTSYLLYRTMDDFSFTKRITKEYFDWMAKKPWTSDGKTFSDRIWKDQKTLVDELYKEFTVSATRGANLKEAARRMSRKMDVSYKKCLRLLNTEDSFFSNKAVMDAYQNTTAEEYMILATLDRRTCEICGDQDTKHYKIKDAKVGVNMPPFHPNCRCTTVVYFGDEEDMSEERMMRDENGKSVKTEYMSYDEWKKKYVDKNGEMIRNEDKKLYVDIKDDYKNVSPGIVEDLQEVEIDGKVYSVNGKDVVLDYSEYEKNIADWIAYNMGGVVKMCPRILVPEDIRTPDYIWNGEKWDLKTINSHSKNTISTAIGNAKKQSENVVLNLNVNSYTDKDLISELDRIYANHRYSFLKKIMIIEDYVLRGIYKRK